MSAEKSPRRRSIEVGYGLGAPSIQLGLAPADPNARTGRATTTLSDALVDRTGNRYLVLATAAYTGATSDVVVLSLDAKGASIAGDGCRFGSTSLDESGYRILQPSEGGFVFTGQAATAAQGPLNFWVTRTDEGFNVPFNGNPPGDQRLAPLAYATPVDLKLTGSAFTCASWVDTTQPTQATIDTPHLPFVPAVNVQAP